MKNHSLSYIRSVLNNNEPAFIEGLAQEAQNVTRQFFGRTMSLYAPIYISNFCSSNCTYCGFGINNKIKRFKLTKEQIDQEMSFISKKGIENILLLTGESYKATPLSYIKEAVNIAKLYFPNIAIEMHPMEEDEYRELFNCGVDGLTIYQETYDRETYKKVHLSGKKSDYDYRIKTPERAAKAGIRSISLGILLGLSEVSSDLFMLYDQLEEMEKNFPGVEYSISFPRLRPIKGNLCSFNHVNDLTLTKIICITRVLFPRVGINLSTRENPEFRDHAIEFGITKISAGSNTSVGGYVLKTKKEQEPQFEIYDNRDLEEIIRTLKTRNFDPVLTDWRRI